MVLLSDQRRGFTIVELLVVIAIITALAALSLPYVMSFQTRNNLGVAQNTLAQTYRRAQTLSRAVERDSAWGVHVLGTEIILYKGTSYASRDTAFDEKYEIGSNVAITGLNDVSFTRVEGIPSATGTTNLSTNGETKAVSLNGKGIVTY